MPSQSGTLILPPTMKILVVRLSSLFNLFVRYFHPETLQLANQPFALLVHVAPVEVVTPEVLIGGTLLQDVMGDHENTVAHGDERFLLAHPFHQAFVLCCQVGLFLMTGR